MSRDKNKDVFAERLARLDSARSNAGHTNAGRAKTKRSRTQRKEKTTDLRMKAPKRSRDKMSLVRRIQLWGIFLIFLFIGGAYSHNLYPGYLNGYIEHAKELGRDTKNFAIQLVTATGLNGPTRLGSLEPYVPSGQKDPKSDIQHTETGDKIHTPTVLTADGSEVLMRDIFSNYHPGSDTASPASIIQFDTLDNCKPRPPKDNEKVIGARLAQHGLKAQVQAFDKTQVRDVLLESLDDALDHLRHIQVTGKGRYLEKFENWNTVDGQMRPIDVVITDTTKPLYLVLQSQSKQVLWNLHLAPGVQLAHVVMISNGKIAISGLPANTSYEAMKIRDFVTQHEFGNDDEYRECMIRPWRKPQPVWIAWQKAQRDKDDKILKSFNTTSLHQNMIYSFTKGYEAYNYWYTGAFGVDADLNTAVAQSASHVLLGPKPAEKLAYHNIGDNDLLISKSDHVITGDAATRNADVSMLHNKLMQAVLGGDLEHQWPSATTGGMK